MAHHGTEATLVFSRCNKGANHAAIVVRIAVVKNVEPKVVAGLIRISPEAGSVAPIKLFAKPAIRMVNVAANESPKECRSRRAPKLERSI